MDRRRVAALVIASVLTLPGGALAGPDTGQAAQVPLLTAVNESPQAPGAPASGGGSQELVAPRLSREEAIAIARKHFAIPASLGEPRVGINQSRESAVWEATWESPSRQPERLRISVSIDAVTGTVLSYSLYRWPEDGSLQLSVTRAEAEARAREWFEKLVPAEYRQSLHYDEDPLRGSYGPVTYQFWWDQHVKGYPFLGYGVRIAIDARTGEMKEYSFTWRKDAALELPEKILTPDEALAAYRGQVEMVLQYQAFTKPGTDETEWKLVYRPLTDRFPPMNQEGVLVDDSGKPLDLEAFRRTKLVPASEKAYVKPAQPLDQEAALAVASAIAGRTDTPSQSSYSESGEEVKRGTWDFTWEGKAAEGQPAGNLMVRIDAETGLLVYYSKWSDIRPLGEGKAVSISREEAEEKAIAFIRAHRPDLAGSLRLRPEPEPGYVDLTIQPTAYFLFFEELRDGVPVMGSGVSVSVSAQTGEILHFSVAGWWEERKEQEFPPAKPAISPEEAIDLFLERVGLKAAWTTLWSRQDPTPREIGALLVWGPGWPAISIDAMTGALLDWQGRDMVEAQRYPDDIKGHYAEREIEILWARRILDLQDGKFNPDAAASAEDLARWIVLARGLGPYVHYDFHALSIVAPRAARLAEQSADSAYFGAAFQQGIILPEELEGLQDLRDPVPRELFALWAVRAMGYGRIADMKARIEMPFGDRDQVGERYRNAVALLAGLGIVSGDAEGRFRPQEPVTRGEAAKILFAIIAR